MTLLLAATLTTHRDIFHFAAEPKPKAHATRTKVSAKPRVIEAPPVVAKDPQIRVLIPPPTFPWTYIGSFGPSSTPIAVFKRDRDLVNVREGETLDTFVVKAIDAQWVEVVLAKPHDVRRIPLGR